MTSVGRYGPNIILRKTPQAALISIMLRITVETVSRTSNTMYKADQRPEEKYH